MKPLPNEKIVLPDMLAVPSRVATSQTLCDKKNLFGNVFENVARLSQANNFHQGMICDIAKRTKISLCKQI